MLEDLLQEVERDYEQLRAANEREEAHRREKIMTEQPEIFRLVCEREELVLGTIRKIANGGADTDGLPEKMENLSDEIRNKLQQSGYPSDYLAPIYRCPKCRDTGRTGEPVREYCTCLKKAYQQKLRQKIGLTSGHDETFDSFDLSLFSNQIMPGDSFSQRDLMKLVRDDCLEWTDRFPDNTYRDIVLSGQSGLGKTFLLRAMADRLIERNVNVLIISAYRMLEILRESYFSRDNGISDLMEAQVLMIDDLGTEPMMQNITVEQLFNLLNERQNRGLSTVISTNLDMARFRERYTERIASRMTDIKSSMVLTLRGKDIRTTGGAGEG